MAIEILEDAEQCEAWDDFLQDCSGAHFWQLHGWLSSYTPMGLRPGVLVKTDQGRIVAGAAFVAFRLPAGLGQVFLLPHGPVCEDPESSDFEELMGAFHDHCRDRRAVYIQAWPHVEPKDEAGLERFVQAGYRGPRLFHSHNFSSRVLAIDIGNKCEEEVLAQARKKTRYYCRRSLKSGLELQVGTSEEFLEQCHRIWDETLRYHGWPARPIESYRIVLNRLIQKDKGFLIQATKDGQIAGALAVLFAGGTATYLMGGLRREFAGLYPSEFLHLAAMRLAREQGLETYDFNNWGGEGTAQFKRGFRPQERQWAAPRTLILRPAIARTISWGEKRARRLVRTLARLRAS